MPEVVRVKRTHEVGKKGSSYKCPYCEFNNSRAEKVMSHAVSAHSGEEPVTFTPNVKYYLRAQLKGETVEIGCPPPENTTINFTNGRVTRRIVFRGSLLLSDVYEIVENVLRAVSASPNPVNAKRVQVTFR